MESAAELLDNRLVCCLLLSALQAGGQLWGFGLQVESQTDEQFLCHTHLQLLLSRGPWLSPLSNYFCKRSPLCLSARSLALSLSVTPTSWCCSCHNLPQSFAYYLLNLYITWRMKNECKRKVTLHEAPSNNMIYMIFYNHLNLIQENQVNHGSRF